MKRIKTAHLLATAILLASGVAGHATQHDDQPIIHDTGFKSVPAVAVQDASGTPQIHRHFGIVPQDLPTTAVAKVPVVKASSIKSKFSYKFKYGSFKKHKSKKHKVKPVKKQKGYYTPYSKFGRSKYKGKSYRGHHYRYKSNRYHRY